MFYLLWCVLNIGLFIWFIFVCIKATRYIREKFGLIAAGIFVFALFSFISRPVSEFDNRMPNSNMAKTWNFQFPDSLDQRSTYLMQAEMNKTWISTYHIGVVYAKDEMYKANFPVRASTWTTGLNSGTSWQPISIVVNPTDDINKFTYSVVGTVKWSLLTIPIYVESKKWEGTIFSK